MFARFVSHPQSVTLRRALFQVHLWAGVALGLYVLAVSLTGSTILYRSELDDLLAARTIIVTPHGRRLTDAQLLAAVRADYSSFHFSAIRIRGPRVPGAAVEVWLLFGMARISRGRIERLFDPYTGADLGDAVGREPAAISWIGRLHENLLAGVTGRALNGAGAVLLTPMCITGAVLWWPGRARWRRSLSLRRGVGWRRFTWDLHSVLGFWVFLLILMWSVTGIYLALPDFSYSLIGLFTANGTSTAASRFVNHVIDWLVRLHFGRSFGPYGKALLAILGLVPAALFVTGVLMWWNRVLRRNMQPLAVEPGGSQPTSRQPIATQTIAPQPIKHPPLCVRSMPAEDPSSETHC
ncbi:MAG: PepSY-associated TM helix domain-containing protein [Steroidobacteraceae bacterium]